MIIQLFQSCVVFFLQVSPSLNEIIRCTLMVKNMFDALIQILYILNLNPVFSECNNHYKLFKGFHEFFLI